MKYYHSHTHFYMLTGCHFHVALSFICHQLQNIPETQQREDCLHKKWYLIRQVIDLWRGNLTAWNDSEVPLATNETQSAPILFVISN